MAGSAGHVLLTWRKRVPMSFDFLRIATNQKKQILPLALIWYSRPCTIL